MSKATFVGGVLCLHVILTYMKPISSFWAWKNRGLLKGTKLLLEAQGQVEGPVGTFGSEGAVLSGDHRSCQSGSTRNRCHTEFGNTEKVFLIKRLFTKLEGYRGILRDHTQIPGE